MSKEKLLAIVDGNNIAMRAHFAFKKHNFTSNDGVPTGALFGTIIQHINIVKHIDPTHLVWFFDAGKSRERTAELESYKGNRENQPSEVYHQFDLIDKFLSIAGVRHYREHGVEADDLIAKAVKSWGDIAKVIITGDHDMRQLVSDSPKVSVLQPISAKVDPVIWNTAKVVSEYGVPPEKLPEVWSICGDSSDNIKGVPRIGPKGASKIIQKYGDISNALVQEEKLRGYADLIEKNFRLIYLDGSFASLPISLNDCVFNKDMYDKKFMYDFLDKYSINSIKTKVHTVGIY